MGIIKNKNYEGVYYNNFNKVTSKTPPIFNQNENFMMRFKTKLSYYKYLENTLTIIFFKQGYGNLIMKNESLKIKGNTFLISNPGNDWEYINQNNHLIDVLSFAVSNDLLNKFIYFTSTKEVKLLDTPFNSIGRESFFTQRAFAADRYHSGRLLKHIHNYSASEYYNCIDATEFTMEVLQSIFQEQSFMYSKAKYIDRVKYSTKIETMKRLLTAYEYIYDNLEQKITLTDLSQVAMLSEYHLYNSFKKVFKRTPHKYINTLKMRKAKEYICKGDYSVSDVAFMLNYPDVATFSKLYKKFNGVPPSQHLN